MLAKILVAHNNCIYNTEIEVYLVQRILKDLTVTFQSLLFDLFEIIAKCRSLFLPAETIFDHGDKT